MLSSTNNVLGNRLAKIAEVKSKLTSSAFRGNLKSTGQSKYALDEKEEGVCIDVCWQLQYILLFVVSVFIRMSDDLSAILAVADRILSHTMIGYWHHDIVRLFVCPSIMLHCGTQGGCRRLKVELSCPWHTTSYSLLQTLLL